MVAPEILLNFPLLHSVQLVAAVVLAYVPSEQLWHVLWEVAPVAMEKDPLWHVLQSAADVPPEVPRYVPAIHKMQKPLLDAFKVEEYLPALHPRHALTVLAPSVDE